VDFNWVKQLADQANQNEFDRQEQEKKSREELWQVAITTAPFIEKLHTVIKTFTDEFNKHCMFDRLRAVVSSVQSRTKIAGNNNSPLANIDTSVDPDEVAYFSFARKSWLFGIRGINGVIEFVEFPITEGSGGYNIKMDELGVSPSKRLAAYLNKADNKVEWYLDEKKLAGPEIIDICKQYFSDFISRTHE
jgi:hypothetical protein